MDQLLPDRLLTHGRTAQVALSAIEGLLLTLFTVPVVHLELDRLTRQRRAPPTRIASCAG